MRRLTYRDNMTPDDVNALLAECSELDQCYADADAARAAAELFDVDDEEYEVFDTVRDGWVGKDGRP